MDGLSAAASAIAVIQISFQIFDFCMTYYLNVKDARNDIQRLRNEIISLQDILISVIDLVNAPNSGSMHTLDLVNKDEGSLKQCQLELTALAAKLDPGETSSKFKLALRTVKWPLNSKEVHKTLAAISRYKSLFVLALTTDQVNLSLAMGRDLSEIKYQLEAQKTDGDRVAIIYWLSTTDPSVNFHASCKKCQPETGKWVVDRGDFNEWRVSRNSFLWIHGIPGCGKTILTSTIIQHLQLLCNNRPKIALAYYYFDFNTSAKQEVSACISSINSQLCAQLNAVPFDIKLIYERCNYGKLQPSVEELKEVFFRIIEEMEHVFIVIDALDECPRNRHREQLLAVISDIKSRSLDSLHVLVTSRREPDIEKALLPLLSIPPIPLQGSQVDLDINLHILSSLSTDPQLKKWSKQVKAKVENTLTNKANGMFRWVDCQLDALKRCLKASSIYETLAHLPRTLDETYERLFLAIDPAYQQDAKNAVLWLAFSKRSLVLTELSEAMVINPEASLPFDPEERFSDPQSIFQILSSLITVSLNEDQSGISNADGGVLPVMTVTLAHFSVMEYLMSDRIQQSPAKHFAASKSTGNHFIAECCLLYMLQYAGSTSRTDSSQDLYRFPLLKYASIFWYLHANLASSEQQKSLNSLVLKLLLSKSNLSTWLRLHVPIARGVEPFEYFEGGRSVTIPLHYASDIGLVSTVEELLSNGFEPNSRSESYETPLHRAVIRGHEYVIILLLDHGADVNAKDIKGLTPLHCAMETTTPIVRLLLEYGADVNTADNGGWTPLHLAAFYSHTGIARMLVGNGARVEVMTIDSKQTPLHWAAWNENGPLLDLLLQHGANANAQNSKGESALHYAARYNQSILPQLLEHGADVNMETACKQTPLYWAALNMETQAVKVLVHAGARTDTPLLTLGENGLHSVFHLLLSAGVENPKSATMTEMTLRESARRGYGLCKECHSILSDWEGQGSGTLQSLGTEKKVESPDASRRYKVEMVVSQTLVPHFKWHGTAQHFQIRLFPNADGEEDAAG